MVNKQYNTEQFPVGNVFLYKHSLGCDDIKPIFRLVGSEDPLVGQGLD